MTDQQLLAQPWLSLSLEQGDFIRDLLAARTEYDRMLLERAAAALLLLIQQARTDWLEAHAQAQQTTEGAPR